MSDLLTAIHPHTAPEPGCFSCAVLAGAVNVVAERARRAEEAQSWRLCATTSPTGANSALVFSRRGSP